MRGREARAAIARRISADLAASPVGDVHARFDGNGPLELVADEWWAGTASFALLVCGAVVLILGLAGAMNLGLAGLLTMALAALAGAKLMAAAHFGGGLRELASGLRELSAARRGRKRRRPEEK
jgi:hypothetical protein